MDYGNNYTPQQINDAYQQLLNGGTSVSDIIYGAKNNLGIGADQLIAAQHAFDPTQNIGTDNYIRSLYGEPAPQSSTPTPSAPMGMGGAGSGVNLNAYTQNPYLTQMADGLRTQFNNNLTMNTLPALRGGAVQTGGVGGSRQGIAEGLATSQSNIGADNAIASLYGTDYNNQMNRNLQQYQGDQSYNLGLGGLSNQKYGMDQNFYTQQRGQDQQGALIGANLYGAGTTGQFGPLTDSANIYSPFTGFGTTSGSTSAGGGLNGILGGAVAGSQLGNFGFGGVPKTANSFGGVNGTGFGTGAMFGNQDMGQFF